MTKNDDRFEWETVPFLRALFRDTEGAVEARACANDVGGGARPLMNGDRDMALMRSFIARNDRAGNGVYVGICTRRVGAARGDRASLLECPAVWVDIDARKGGLAQDDVIAALLDAAPLPPSIVVLSGNGVHGYWLLKEPADVTEIEGEAEEQIVGTLKQLAGVFAGDRKVCDLARIMRLPGTHNSKPEALAANDGQPIGVKLYYCDADRRYDLGELDDWLDVQRPLLVGPENGMGRGPAETDPFLVYARQIGARIPVDVTAALAAMTFGGPEDSSIHQTQLRVSAHLVAKGHEDEEIVELLLTATGAAAGAAGKGWKWKREESKIRRMVAGARARGFAPKAQEQPAVQAAAGAAASGAAATAEREPAAAPPGSGEIVSLSDARARKGKKPNAGGGGAAAGSAAQRSDIEDVAASVVAKWEAERGPLISVIGDLWSYRGGAWTTLGDADLATLRSWIHGMSCALQKKPTLGFKANVLSAIVEDPTRARGDVKFDALGVVAGLDGSIAVRTGERLAHDQFHFCTIKLPCNVATPTAIDGWLGYLDRCFADRPDEERRQIIELLQEWTGAALVRGKDDDLTRALILYGEGGTGKSRFANVVTHLMGGDGRVARTTVAQLNSRFGKAGLIGKTAWIKDDAIGRKDDLAAEDFKCLVSGEGLPIERKNQEDWCGRVDIPILLTANSLPRIGDTTNAVYRRLLILPMNVKHAGPEKRNDRELDALLLGELPGILHWAIDGYRRLAARGHFELPTSMRRQLERYKADNDPLKTWWEDCVEVNDSFRVMRQDVLACLNGWFDEWHGSEGKGRGWGAKSLNMQLPTLAPTVDYNVKSNGNYFYSGIRLTETGLRAWEAYTMRNPTPTTNVSMVNKHAPIAKRDRGDTVF